MEHEREIEREKKETYRQWPDNSTPQTHKKPTHMVAFMLQKLAYYVVHVVADGSSHTADAMFCSL